MDKVLFSSKTDLWSTPQDLFDKLDNIYHFDLDPCALPENAKCKKFFTPDDDGLSKDWSGHSVFCNPPYGKQIVKWVEKCYKESLKPNTFVCLLIPSRTDTTYFHDFILDKANITFLRGRLKFGDSKNVAPFPSLIACYGNPCLQKCL